MSHKNKSNTNKHKYNTRKLIHNTDDEEEEFKDDDNFKFFINNITSNFFVVNKEVNIENNDCIGPCFPKNSYVYNPINLMLQFSDKDICPVKPYKDSENKKNSFKDCKYKGDKEYLNFNPLDNNNPYLLIAKNDDFFLKEIYNLNDINQVYDFINNQLNNLPIYTQKRILNAIFNSYIRDDLFPNNNYINSLKKILSSIYKINISFDKIYKNIIKFKNSDIIDTDDILSFLFNKYSE